jgi:alkylation response protein AidB-like acyl-CoA dehydrogenase
VSASVIESTAELDALREMARQLLDKESPTDTVRAVAATADGFDADLWACLADVGWTGLWVAEEFGGAGHHPLELAVILEELGRHAAGGPFLATALLGAAAIGASTDTSVRHDHLPALVAGRRKVAVAMTAAFGSRDAVVRAETDPGGVRLSGSCRFVPDAHVADLLVVYAMGDGTEGLYLLDRDAPGVDVAVEPTADETRRLCRLVLDGVTVNASSLLVPQANTAELVEHLVRLAALGLAADSAGGARCALEMTVDYTKQRRQFGRTIASFQVIKHRCADMYLQVEASASSVMQAAAETLSDSGDAVASSVAKSYACDAYVSVTHEAVLTHGAIGAMWEHDLHLFLKRAKLNQALFGSSAWYRRRIVDTTIAANGRSVI